MFHIGLCYKLKVHTYSKGSTVCMNVNLPKNEPKDVNYEDQVEVQEVDQNHVLIQKGTLRYNGRSISQCI
jgi:hypothetical protein